MPLAITPTPWYLGYASRAITTSNPGIRLAMFGGAAHASNAEAVVTAINNSYGAGINAAVVPEMKDTLQFAAQVIWQFLYNEAIAGGADDANAKDHANNHPKYLKVKNTLTKATTL